MITVWHYAILSALLFVIGLYGALTRRNAISVLMSVELMFNAANINFVAFSYYFKNENVAFLAGQVFPLFVIAIAASEVTVGLALALALYRNRSVVNLDSADILRG